MVNIDYYIENKKKDDKLEKIKLNPVVKSVASIVTGLSLYFTWADRIISAEIAFKAFINSLYIVAIGLFLIIGIFYITSVFSERIRNILNDEKIKENLESYDYMFSFIQLITCIGQLFILLRDDNKSILYIIIGTIIILLIYILSFIYIISQNKSKYDNRHIFCCMMLFIVFSFFTYYMFHLIPASFTMFIMALLLVPLFIYKKSIYYKRYTFYSLVLFLISSALAFWILQLVCISLVMLLVGIMLIYIFINEYYKDKYVKLKK